ncbi:CRISPR-associated helicase/endonuclease Cas3 [Methylobacterium terrae]|uniref:CRISPR-associated helicase/endonuclease Cas3 n=1 Tax=Methylobacterium terrae TaxID=2202827 RepID=A0A2U8WQ38_9HYPH|nr:CRISPR-associated helicase Cas3' [Methylobacterium terrae]AWN47560.1 CRISPR-associated helicase/endonuclease Cas3 [Methylobacterium terrae]
MTAFSQDDLWAKRDAAGRWHSLVGHSADVGAVLAALLDLPTIGERLRRFGRTDAAAASSISAKLSALAFLHDVGKANRGFQARSDANAPRVGHIDELAWVFSPRRGADAVCDRLSERLGLDRVAAWLPEDEPDLFHAVFAHHGRPWALGHEGSQADVRDASAQWRGGPGDPVARLGPMRAALDAWFGDALADGSPLPDQPAVAHAFAGLLMLADWLGSNPGPGFFPFDEGRHADRMAFARERAADVLTATGLDAQPAREAARRVGAGFPHAFAQAGRPPFAARPIQAEAARHPAQLLVLEAETGSGKTEAALWRFIELFRAGAVDGLYFALPTRVAATQIFERVKRFRDNVFPPDWRPAVVLAVPGQMRVDEAEGARLPDFDVQWNDDGDRAARWAAEHPKRYLAAPIAVGTIDQALLGAVRVKHAHLRAVSLLGKLLVIDEVHASDAYMERLLANLLRFHVGAGGHALLLSATLGAGARARLLGAATVPDRAAADAVDYPALSWCEDGVERRQPLGAAGEGKAVRLEARPILADPDAVAASSLAAARAGAKVLIVRNTVGQALRTQEALEALATRADGATLFRVPHADGRGIATLHHSRFAEPDRRLLDAAVEAAIGREREAGGRIVVGTQTLEQSLDLDADLLLTDLCPVDVLLQRIGRLHRHAGRPRPAGYAAPRAVVLVPEGRELFRADLRAYGLGSGETGGVYEDLRILELTRRLVEAEPVWTIPAMNRRLVEAATHPDALAAIEAELTAADPAWRPHFDRRTGRYFADLNAAQGALLRFDRPFTAFRIEPDEIIATRIGGADRHVAFDVEGQPLPTGPFGRPVPSLKLPHHVAANISVDAQPDLVETLGDGDGFTFRLGPSVFTYDRFGLRRNA